jgi:TolB-like protein
VTEQRSFFAELRKRHVVRAAVAHVVVFWLLVQVADVVLPYIGIADEPVRWAVIAAVGFFPFTLIIAWFFEHPWHRVTGSRLVMDLAIISVIAIVSISWAVRNIPRVMHTRTSIVILPFEYVQDMEHGSGLSRALALEINSLLMKSGSIDVVGYESANSPVLAGLDLPAVFETLNVEHALSGVIRSAGASMNLSVGLHDAGGRELWSAEIEDDVDNLYAVQERIAAEVQARLGEGEESKPVAEVAVVRCPMPSDPGALDRYYTARHYTESRSDSEQSREDLREAIVLYEDLITEYPEFSQARSGLAWALMYQVTYDPRSTDREVNGSRAKQMAQEAYDLCPTLGEALVILPNQSDHENGWINHEQNLQLWMELQPEATENYQKYIRHLREVGRNSKALEEAERNYALNPLSVRSIKELKFTLQHMGRLDEAVALEDKAMALGSSSPLFAANQKKIEACQQDLECMLKELPPPFKQYVEPFRFIYSSPDSSDDAAAKVQAAVDLLRTNPDMLVNWMNYSACRFPHLTSLFFEAAIVAQDSQVYWHWPNVWGRHCGNVWSFEAFPAFVEEAGLVEYWRAKGWADACRPDGEGFVCAGPSGIN